MGEQLKQVNKEYDGLAEQAEAQLAKMVKSKEWEYAKAAVDAAGIADPTPVSDCIGAAMSLAEGDFVGAGLSLVSVVPYFGDAVAKAAKGLRATKKITALAESIAKVSKGLDQLKDKFARRKAAAERVRKARREAVGSVQECAKKGKWGDGIQLPATGKWSPPDSKGHGKWTSDDGKYSVEYREGYPDFSNAKGPAGSDIIKGKVEIDMSGNRKADDRLADEAMRKIHGDDWSKPDGYTWHHNEDGTTMELVRRDVHDKAESGAAHAGGASLVKSEEF